MSTTVAGLDPATLSPAERNAFAILTNVDGPHLGQLKNLMHVGYPAVVGPDTLRAFQALCQARGLDLSPAGVSSFKSRHVLGDSGANRGVIGPQTAEVYVAVLLGGAPAPAGVRRHVTDRGLQLVETFEGLSLDAYRDQVGVPTIGWGHTAGVRMGQVITRARAEAYLRADIAIAEEAVSRLVLVPLTAEQFDALASFTFNVGTGALASSGLLRLLNARDYRGAADQLPRWCNGDRGPLPGLVARRAAERALFLTPSAS